MSLQAWLEDLDDQNAPAVPVTVPDSDANLEAYHVGISYGRALDNEGVIIFATTSGSAERSYTNPALRQRFMRCIAQARVL